MFSVIIPVYNKADVVEHSIKSVLMQLSLEDELIIVNDGSTDDVENVLAKYHHLLNVKILHQKNKGVSAARNLGIQYSKGDIITFLDADDTWTQDNLKVMRHLLALFPQAGLYCAAAEIITPRGKYYDSFDILPQKPKEPICIEDFFAFSLTFKGSILYTGALCIPKRILDHVGLFKEGAKIGEDTDLWLRIAAYHPVACSPKKTLVYHRELSSATKETWMDTQWYFEKREANLLRDEKIPPEKRKNLWRYMERFRISKARHLLLTGNRWEAWQVMKQVSKNNGLLYQTLLTYVFFCIPKMLLQKIYKKYIQ